MGMRFGGFKISAEPSLKTSLVRGEATSSTYVFGDILAKSLQEEGANLPPLSKTSLGTWRISTYYTPQLNQPEYFNGSYQLDYKINCSGDCLVTASGYNLSQSDAQHIVACPPPYSLGTRFWTEEHGVLRCEDRGGAIKGKRLDLYVGVGTEGYANIGRGSGYYEIFLINS